MNLFVVVQDWSTATFSGSLGKHARQLVGVVFGIVLVIAGIVSFGR